MMEQMMRGPPDDEDDTGAPKTRGEDEDFMFEKYLKSGDYLDITRKRR